MKININNKFKKGFTLIEVILYLSIFIILITLCGIAMQTVNESSSKNKEMMKIDNDANHILYLMTNYIKNSERIISPSANSNSDSMQIKLQNSSTTVSFGVVNGELFVNEGGNGNVTLTSPDEKVDSLLITNLGTNGTSGAVEIIMTLSSTKEDLGYNKYTKTYEVSASPRF